MFDCMRTATAAIAAPKARLFINRMFWNSTLGELHRRGREEVEAGAFLLGRDIGGRRFVSDRVFYDDLDPRCADTGGIHLDLRAFGALWKICKHRGLQVVADVHTHPGAAEQSLIDKQNPAVSVRGHLAVIIPRFAAERDAPDLGVFEYAGERRWHDRSSTGHLKVAWWIV